MKYIKDAKLKDLAEQAGFLTFAGPDIHAPEDPYSDGCAAQLAKFAELIVKECAELSVNSQYANTKSEYYEGFNEALIYAGNKILEHFGVEE